MNAARGQPLDARTVGQRLEEPDENLSAAQPFHLVGRRLAHLHDRVCIPDRIRHLSAGIGVGLIRKRGSCAGAGLDDDVETGWAKACDGVRDECHPALAWLELPRDADAHGASLRSLVEA